MRTDARALAWTAPWLLAAALASPAAAQALPGEDAPLQGAPAIRATPVPGQAEPPTPAPPARNGFWERDTFLGDPGGLRSRLEGYGVSLGLLEASEVLGNVTGGQRRGVIYEGLATATLGIDLDRAVGLPGGSLKVSALQIHGRGLSTNAIGNLNTASSIEATRATRLFELWFQQSFFGGRADLRVGQQGADLEFATTEYGGLFLNAGFGWPTAFAVNLPAGGPAYPLAALGARLRAQPAEPLTVLLGIFNGSPARFGDGDPQGPRNPSGASFRLNEGVFVIGEAQYRINGSVGGGGAPGLPGLYKLGAWYNSNAFTNQFFTGPGGIEAGGLAAVPPRAARGDWSLYAVADQLVWRPTGAKVGGVGVFARVAGAPGDRNLVNLSLNGGVTYKGVFGRDDDTVGLGVGWARISDTTRSADGAAASDAGFRPVRTGETVLELSYQAQLAPWWQVQPDLQYVLRPGGGIADPDRPGRRIGDAAILGVRTTILF